jgi:hypothetical protein
VDRTNDISEFLTATTPSARTLSAACDPIVGELDLTFEAMDLTADAGRVRGGPEPPRELDRHDAPGADDHGRRR